MIRAAFSPPHARNGSTVSTPMLASATVAAAAAAAEAGGGGGGGAGGGDDIPMLPALTPKVAPGPDPIASSTGFARVALSVIVDSYSGDRAPANTVTGADGLMHGRGFATFKNGCTYDGPWHDGMMHGADGTYTWMDGTTYSGQFTHNCMTGLGRYVWPDGSTYTGPVLNGLRHGANGVFRQPALGLCYDGAWRHGKRHGANGTCWYDDPIRKQYYTGDWADGFRHGTGTMRYKSGNSYTGEWSRDKKNGRGTMHWINVPNPPAAGGHQFQTQPQQHTYTGEWADDQPNGEGEYVWGEVSNTNTGIGSVPPPLPVRSKSDKTIDPVAAAGKPSVVNRYVGTMKNGVRDGFGTFVYATGAVYTGEFSDNIKHGTGTYVWNNGTRYSGDFTLDTMAQQKSWHSQDTTRFDLQIDDLLDATVPLVLPPPPPTAGAAAAAAAAAVASALTAVTKLAAAAAAKPGGTRPQSSASVASSAHDAAAAAAAAATAPTAAAAAGAAKPAATNNAASATLSTTSGGALLGTTVTLQAQTEGDYQMRRAIERQRIANVLLRHHSDLIDIYRFYAAQSEKPATAASSAGAAVTHPHEEVKQSDPPTAAGSMEHPAVPATLTANPPHQPRMKLKQLWSLLRDCQLISPHLSLAEIDRLVLRHLRHDPVNHPHAHLTAVAGLESTHNPNHELLEYGFVESLVRVAHHLYYTCEGGVGFPTATPPPAAATPVPPPVSLPISSAATTAASSSAAGPTINTSASASSLHAHHNLALPPGSPPPNAVRQFPHHSVAAGSVSVPTSHSTPAPTAAAAAATATGSAPPAAASSTGMNNPRIAALAAAAGTSQPHHSQAAAQPHATPARGAASVSGTAPPPAANATATSSTAPQQHATPAAPAVVAASAAKEKKTSHSHPRRPHEIAPSDDPASLAFCVRRFLADFVIPRCRVRMGIVKNSASGGNTAPIAHQRGTAAPASAAIAVAPPLSPALIRHQSTAVQSLLTRYRTQLSTLYDTMAQPHAPSVSLTLVPTSAGEEDAEADRAAALADRTIRMRQLLSLCQQRGVFTAAAAAPAPAPAAAIPTPAPATFTLSDALTVLNSGGSSYRSSAGQYHHDVADRLSAELIVDEFVEDVARLGVAKLAAERTNKLMNRVLAKHREAEEKAQKEKEDAEAVIRAQAEAEAAAAAAAASARAKRGGNPPRVKKPSAADVPQPVAAAAPGAAPTAANAKARELNTKTPPAGANPRPKSPLAASSAGGAPPLMRPVSPAATATPDRKADRSAAAGSRRMRDKPESDKPADGKAPASPPAGKGRPTTTSSVAASPRNASMRGSPLSPNAAAAAAAAAGRPKSPAAGNRLTSPPTPSTATRPALPGASAAAPAAPAPVQAVDLFTPAALAAAADELNEPDTDERLAVRLDGFIRTILDCPPAPVHAFL